MIEIFEEQIKNGGPVTITDKGMKRYFYNGKADLKRGNYIGSKPTTAISPLSSLAAG